LTPTALDRTATRFTLQVDGQTLIYRHDPQTPTRVTWSPQTSALAAVAIEDGSPNRPGFEARGPWALFRLIDQAQVEAQGAGRATLTFKLGAHEARVLVEPQNARNPVTSRNLLQFQCEI
jgi:type VI secretion system protein ImpL